MGLAPGTRRALVVDDEENVAYLATTALQLDGWDTTVAGSGRAALDAADAFHPDVIVLDVRLPDLDGFELCRRLRRAGSTTPVIFLTACDTTDDRVLGLTIGGDDYLTKPFSVEELVARCRLRSRPGGAGEGDLLRYRDVELDPEAHRVRRGGDPVHLSPTEFRLLQYLLLNPGRVLSRRQIVDHVWCYGFDGDPTIVESYVSTLRRKVDTGDVKLIHTVRGVGYVLRDEGTR